MFNIQVDVDDETVKIYGRLMELLGQYKLALDPSQPFNRGFFTGLNVAINVLKSEMNQELYIDGEEIVLDVEDVEEIDD